MYAKIFIVTVFGFDGIFTCVDLQLRGQKLSPRQVPSQFTVEKNTDVQQILIYLVRLGVAFKTSICHGN